MTQDSGSVSIDDRDQLREIREAQEACESALRSLGEAQRRVDSARSWGTYDTWFGGGLFSSMIKHGRIDEAEGYMHAVDAALERLRRELADVHMDGAASAGSVSPTSPTPWTCGSTTSSPTSPYSPGSTTPTTGSMRSARPWSPYAAPFTTGTRGRGPARRGLTAGRSRIADCPPD